MTCAVVWPSFGSALDPNDVSRAGLHLTSGQMVNGMGMGPLSAGLHAGGFNFIAGLGMPMDPGSLGGSSLASNPMLGFVPAADPGTSAGSGGGGGGAGFPPPNPTLQAAVDKYLSMKSLAGQLLAQEVTIVNSRVVQKSYGARVCVCKHVCGHVHALLCTCICKLASFLYVCLYMCARSASCRFTADGCPANLYRLASCPNRQREAIFLPTTRGATHGRPLGRQPQRQPPCLHRHGA